MVKPIRMVLVGVGFAMVGVLLAGCGSEPVVESPTAVKSGVGSNPAAQSTTAPKPDTQGN